MEYFCERKPELVSSKYNSVKSNLKSFLELKHKKLVSKYKHFNYPKKLLDWFNNEKDSKTLFLTGKSGVGKTSGIIALLENFNPLLIRDLNALKDLKQDNKTLIMDDINWNSIPCETKIHLLDKDFNSQIRVLYSVVDLPPNLIKVITSNNKLDLLNMWCVDEAISRRLSHVEVTTPMFVQQNKFYINLNVQESEKIN